MRVTLKTALLAKIKGFNEKCKKVYDDMGQIHGSHYSYMTNSGSCYTAPYQYELQKFLRRKDIHIGVWYNDLTGKYRVDYIKSNTIDVVTSDIPYLTYEEALEEALFEGLQLIK